MQTGRANGIPFRPSGVVSSGRQLERAVHKELAEMQVASNTSTSPAPSSRCARMIAFLSYFVFCSSGNSHMGKVLQSISADIRAWIAEQKMFFVATAPLSAESHINCSPKGGDTFRVITEQEVAYLDLTGSGIETISHLQENSRIVVMFCAFTGGPKIVRLHGSGEVLYPSDPRFDVLVAHFPSLPGIRAIIRIKVTRISDSCGLAVPFFDFSGNRDSLNVWAEKKGEADLIAYRQNKNLRSIDGIDGYRTN